MVVKEEYTEYKFHLEWIKKNLVFDRNKAARLAGLNFNQFVYHLQHKRIVPFVSSDLPGTRPGNAYLVQDLENFKVNGKMTTIDDWDEPTKLMREWMKSSLTFSSQQAIMYTGHSNTLAFMANVRRGRIPVFYSSGDSKEAIQLFLIQDLINFRLYRTLRGNELNNEHLPLIFQRLGIRSGIFNSMQNKK